MKKIEFTIRDDTYIALQNLANKLNELPCVEIKYTPEEALIVYLGRGIDYHIQDKCADLINICNIQGLKGLST